MTPGVLHDTRKFLRNFFCRSLATLTPPTPWLERLSSLPMSRPTMRSLWQLTSTSIPASANFSQSLSSSLPLRIWWRKFWFVISAEASFRYPLILFTSWNPHLCLLSLMIRTPLEAYVGVADMGGNGLAIPGLEICFLALLPPPSLDRHCRLSPTPITPYLFGHLPHHWQWPWRRQHR